MRLAGYTEKDLVELYVGYMKYRKAFQVLRVAE
jgi:hypothetical protein